MTSTSTESNPVERMASESGARVEQWLEEYKKLEEEQHRRAAEMIDEGARMAKASLEYGTKLGDEWRKLALQANKQMIEMFSTKWL